MAMMYSFAVMVVVVGVFQSYQVAAITCPTTDGSTTQTNCKFCQATVSVSPSGASVTARTCVQVCNPGVVIGGPTSGSVVGCCDTEMCTPGQGSGGAATTTTTTVAPVNPGGPGNPGTGPVNCYVTIGGPTQSGCQQCMTAISKMAGVTTILQKYCIIAPAQCVQNVVTPFADTGSWTYCCNTNLCNQSDNPAPANPANPANPVNPANPANPCKCPNGATGRHLEMSAVILGVLLTLLTSLYIRHV